VTTTEWEIHFIGTGGLISQPPRALPATLISIRGFSYLFDCGDGTAARLRQVGKLDVDLVAITCVDVSELAGILTLGEVNRRAQRKPLKVIGPPGLKHAMNSLCTLSTFSTGEMFEVVEANCEAVIHQNRLQYLEAVQVMTGSGVISYAYLLYESPIRRHVDAEKAKKLGIKGSDFAHLIAGETVRGVRPADILTGPPRPGRRVIVAGRGRATEQLRVALENSDVAIFATPFTDERLELAEEAGYLTGWEAAKLTHEQNVRLCAIQRLGTYSTTSYQLMEARQFNNSELIAPDDGSLLRVPLRDLGRPTYHSARERNQKPGARERKPQKIRSNRGRQA
jgi:ribonuclease Z